jgi:hypothetical protein
MSRKAGQIVARVANTSLVRDYLGRNPQTGTRNSVPGLESRILKDAC